jgi:hypothetical protein
MYIFWGRSYLGYPPIYYFPWFNSTSILYRFLWAFVESEGSDFSRSGNLILKRILASGWDGGSFEGWSDACTYFELGAIEISVLERACLSCSCKHFGQKNLVKSLLISALDKVIYYNGTFLRGSTKPIFTSQNRVETSWKKFARFFSTCVF